MEQILVIGNEETRSWSSNIPKSLFLQMPSYSLGEDGENNLTEFIIQNVPEDIRAVIIDIDHSPNREICLAFAMALRLCIHDIKTAAFAPIVLMSRMSFESLWESKFSQIILTKAVICESPDNIIDAIGVLRPLSANEYHDNFLSLIKLFPNATEGRHSLANQWGANVLNRTLLGCDLDNPIIRKAKQSLYFKYIRALTYKPQQISSIISSKNDTESLPPAVENLPNASNKNILLIDDEADKGWAIVLSSICAGANFEYSQKRIDNYNDLDEDIRNKIKNDHYDLIFLDLRLNGLREEELKTPENFSGMKILDQIKKNNPGTQVIMLTASNKAWNMKALLERGADRYYIKESPEYAFPFEYSEENALTLLDDIDYCLERSYLRRIYRKIEQLKNHCFDFAVTKSTQKQINTQLDLSFTLLKKAQKNEEFAYAYISLEAIFEILADAFLEEIDKLNYTIKATGKPCKLWRIKSNTCEEDMRPSRKDNYKEYPIWQKIASIYYQLLEEDDKEFGAVVRNLIEKRNAFIHQDRTENDTISDIYNREGFNKLLDSIHELIMLL